MVSLIFLNFGMVLETPLCVAAWKIFFLPPKLGIWTKNVPKAVFEFIEIIWLLIFLNLFYIMKIYIICCVPVQIPYLGKLLFQNALSQSDCRIFKSTISPEQIDETASFFVC